MCLVTYSNKNKYSSLKKIEMFQANPSPLWAYIEITNSCAHKCKWCYQGPDHMHSTHMSEYDYSNILRKLKYLGIYQITLTGGEPLDHPNFEMMVKLADSFGFMIHIVTNGDKINPKILKMLKQYNVTQIQFNFQGYKWHDFIHGVSSFSGLIGKIKIAKDFGFEIVVTTVAGRYNYDDLEQIMFEAHISGADRIRIWDVIGQPDLLGNVDIKEMFKKTQRIATNLGYHHTVSYDPEVEGDIQIPCVAMEGMFLYIRVDGSQGWCCVGDEVRLGNWFYDEADELLNNYLVYSKEMKKTICW